MSLLLVALAGVLGAVLRVVLDSLVGAHVTSRWPAGTALVNVLSSLVLGAVTGLALTHDLPGAVQVGVGVGFCGAFSTFSTAALDVVRLIGERRRVAAVTYAVGTLVASCLAAALGLSLTGAA